MPIRPAIKQVLCPQNTLNLGLGSRWQAPDVDEAGGGTLVESTALIISSQAVIVKEVWRLSTHYLEGIIIEPSGSRGEAPKCPLFLKA